MSDLADRNRIEAEIAGARGENTGTIPEASTHVHDGDAASTSFSHFAERVLPALKQLRSARRVAETLAGESASPALERIGSFALESIRSIDTTLRMTGVYDISELAALESDATRMNAVCRVLDEVAERLRVLAQEITHQVEHVGDAQASAQLVALLALLKTPLKFGSDGPDSA